MRSVYVVLLAAGKSTRLGGTVAKPWCDLAGKPVLAHSLERLSRHPAITSGVIVTADDALESADALARPYGWSVTQGGAERAFSVKEGLAALAPHHPDYVLIHDAARPFVMDHVIDALITALDDGAEAALPGLPPSDSLKKSDNQKVTDRVDRDGIWRVQTPQAFQYDHIKACHDADKDGLATDDSSLVEDNGGSVSIVTGNVMMDKITTQEDLARARLIATGLKTTMITETRMATGYDVHKFNDAPGPIMLGGIALDHDRGFDAHSDGDVALHALTDAIYGLIADGDIGKHFPPSDNQWKGKDSAFFLTESIKALKGEGGSLRFVDLTIIAEDPKITPHRDAMRTRIAGLLGLPVSRVSVKATTSEGLGFTGRREGIAVQSAVTATFPTLENPDDEGMIDA